MGDEIFAEVPAWFSAKLGGYLVPMSDLARIQMMRRLSKHWERIIWVDIDVLVFAPSRFLIRETSHLQLVEELWVARDTSGACQLQRKVNNSVMVVPSASDDLESLERDTLDAIARSESPDKLDAGTRLLTRRQIAHPLPLLTCVGCFGPAVIQDLRAGTGEALSLLESARPAPDGAANLCRSLSAGEGPVAEVSESELADAVGILLARRSAALHVLS